MTLVAQAGVNVDAFQWNGGTLNLAILPYWAKNMAFHTPGDGTLHVPTGRGTVRASIGDWVMILPDSTRTVQVMSNTAYLALY